MLTTKTRIASGLLSLSALAMFAGCTYNRTADAPYQDDCCAGAPRAETPAALPASMNDWPPNAVAGECYARVFVAPKAETVPERVCVKEACERVEIVPARYEWVEEQVTVKDASTQLVEVPAAYKTLDQIIEVEPARTGWTLRSCTDTGQARDVYCFLARPAVRKTVQTQSLASACGTREVAVPAEYQTVRRQKLMAAATTRRITIPAEYQTVERTVASAPGHMEWQRVVCGTDTTVGTANAVKSALMAAGYSPGPLNGELGDQDWSALKAYQVDNGLGIGGLSYETLDKLQVAAK